MPPVHIRRATTADVSRCHEIDQLTEVQFEQAGHPEFVGGGSIPFELAERGIQAGAMLVAELLGQVVGWAFLTRDGGELSIGQISVDPAHQQRGIGTTLLRRVIADACRADEATVVLNTQDDVAWNRPWYERFGFEVIPPDHWTAAMHAIVAEQTAAGLDWSTRLHMRLTLSRQRSGSAT